MASLHNFKWEIPCIIIIIIIIIVIILIIIIIIDLGEVRGSLEFS